EDAERDLALDQAVEFYDLVLDLRPETRRDARLLERRALVLANAARRAEAAVAYTEAAAADIGIDRDEARTALYGQAAEQFFYGGELRKGMSLLQRVLDDLGVHVPRSTRARSIVGQWLRLRFMLRRSYFERRDAPPIDARTRARLDTLWRAIRG